LESFSEEEGEGVVPQKPMGPISDDHAREAEELFAKFAKLLGTQPGKTAQTWPPSTEHVKKVAGERREPYLLATAVGPNPLLPIHGATASAATLDADLRR
jgi:hypothetical protein